MINLLKQEIDKIQDENTLKDVRDYAAQNLEKIRTAKRETELSTINDKYKDKYLLIYGRTLTMNVSCSEENKYDMKIVHVLDVNFVGTEFFRCHAKVIHIEYDNEMDMIKHLTSDFGCTTVDYEEDEQYDVRIYEIAEMIDKEKVDELVKQAKQDINNMLDQWDI